MNSLNQSGRRSTFAKDCSKLFFFAALEFLRLFPLPWVLCWLRILGRLKYYIAMGTRRRAIRWMEVSLPASATKAMRCRLAHQHVINSVVKAFLNRLMMVQDAAKYPELIQVAGLNHIEQTLESGRGVILLTTHVGIPRSLRWYLRTLDYRVIYLLMMGKQGAPKHTFRAWFGRWHRNRYHLDNDMVLGREDLSVQYLKKSYQHLRQNGLVNIAGDGHVGQNWAPGTICGEVLDFPTGGLSLGLMSGAAILPCFTALDSSSRIQIVIQHPLQDAKGHTHGQLESLLRDYTLRIEEYIQRNPTNVFHPKYLAQRKPYDVKFKDNSEDILISN